MVGSSDSIASANIILNSSVADTLREFADELEKSENFEDDLHQLIRRTIKEHKRILFNGNGYDDEWVRIATEERGLLNLRTAADCIPYLVHSKNVEMLERMNVFSEKELASRCEIKMDNYCKCLLIEASTMLDMVRKDILPSVCTLTDELSSTVNNKKKAVQSASCRYESAMIEKLSGLCDVIFERTEYLEGILSKTDLTDIFGCAELLFSVY